MAESKEIDFSRHKSNNIFSSIIQIGSEPTVKNLYSQLLRTFMATSIS